MKSQTLLFSSPLKVLEGHLIELILRAIIVFLYNLCIFNWNHLNSYFGA